MNQIEMGWAGFGRLWLSLVPIVGLLLIAPVSFAGPTSPPRTAGAAIEPELLEAEKAFPASARLVGDNALELQYSIATGYYMYRDRFHFAINGQPVLLTTKSWPPGKLKQDATFGKVTTYRNSVRLLLPLPNTGRGLTPSNGESITLTAISQGCADAGVCYPPLNQKLVLVSGSGAWVNPEVAAISGFSRSPQPGATPTNRYVNGK